LWVTCSECANHYVQSGGCDNESLDDASDDQILDDACLACDESVITTSCSGELTGKTIFRKPFFSS